MTKVINQMLVTRPFLFACLLFLLAACGAKPLPPLSYSDTILAFGDSLTQGYGATPETSYPAVLAKLTNRKVINAGISGETTSEGLIRFDAVLDKHKPALVILMEGGNDILQNQDLSVTKSNLAAMLTSATARQIPVILIGVPEKIYSLTRPTFTRN